jgi:hypothetical protein
LKIELLLADHSSVELLAVSKHTVANIINARTFNLLVAAAQVEASYQTAAP